MCWMEVTHLLKSCLCLPCVSPSFSCIEVIVNDVTATVWKNTVRRGTSNKLDIACPIYWGKGTKKQTEKLVVSCASFSELCDSYVSVIFPEVTYLTLYFIQRDLGGRQRVCCGSQCSITHQHWVLSKISVSLKRSSISEVWRKLLSPKIFLIVTIQNYYSNKQ